MRTSRPTRPIASRLAALLVLAVALAALLAGSVQASSSVCRPASARSGHGPRVCAASRKGASAHARHTAGARHHKRTAHRKRNRRSRPAGPVAGVIATCEGGRAPVVAANGTISCADGGAPACEDGASPRISGSRVICPTAAAESREEAEVGEAGCSGEAACSSSSSEGGEEPCEDGPAKRGEDGSFQCTDGSEPECLSGYRLTVTANGSEMLCVPGGTEPEA